MRGVSGRDLPVYLGFSWVSGEPRWRGEEDVQIDSRRFHRGRRR